MHRLCRELTRHAGGILVEWRSITAEEPWLAGHEPDRTDDLIEVVLRVLDAAVCEGPDGRHAAVRQLVHAATAHGQQRHEASKPFEVLFAEHYLLREAVWRYLRRLGGPTESFAVMALDRAISAMTQASLLSYHAARVDSARVPRRLEQIVRETTEALNGLPTIPS
jgi:hypothetical protein